MLKKQSYLKDKTTFIFRRLKFYSHHFKKKKNIYILTICGVEKSNFYLVQTPCISLIQYLSYYWRIKGIQMTFFCSFFWEESNILFRGLFGRLECNKDCWKSYKCWNEWGIEVGNGNVIVKRENSGKEGWIKNYRNRMSLVFQIGPKILDANVDFKLHFITNSLHYRLPNNRLIDMIKENTII